MEYIVHIGVNKTGTSSLQRAFHTAHHALRARKIIYPRIGLELSAHHGISRTLKGFAPEKGGLAADWKQKLAEECEGMDVCVLSSEDFATMHDPAPLSEICPPGQTRIVIYAREHVAHTVSWYQQAVHSRNITASLPEFVELHLVSYSAIYDRWAAIYGKDNVIVRHYDRAALVAGDIVADFCQFLQPDLIDLFADQSHDSNPSLAGNLLFAKRLINTFITREQSMRIASEMIGLTSIDPSFRGKITVPAEISARIRFLARHDRAALQARTGLKLEVKTGAIKGADSPDMDRLQNDLHRLRQTAEDKGFLCAEFLGKLGAFAPPPLHRSCTDETPDADSQDVTPLPFTEGNLMENAAKDTADKDLVLDVARALFAARLAAGEATDGKKDAWQTSKDDLRAEARRVVNRLRQAGYQITKV